MSHVRAVCLVDCPSLSSKFRRGVKLLLLLLLLHLRLRLHQRLLPLLQHFQAVVGKVGTSNSGKNHGHHRGRDVTVQRVLEHGVFNLPLLQLVAFLTRSLFFLFSLLLLSFGAVSYTHLTLPTKRIV